MESLPEDFEANLPEAHLVGKSRPIVRRKIGPLAVSPTPPLGGAEHVELARLGPGPVRVQSAQDHIGAVLVPGLHDHCAAAQRSNHALLCDVLGRAQLTTGLEAWISWSEITSGAPRRAAVIARAAAIAPAIVVMQGIPREMAAVRIS